MGVLESTERFAVLAALDGSVCTDDVLRVSANLAQLKPRAELHLVHVVEDMRSFEDQTRRKPVASASAEDVARLSREQLRVRANTVRPIFRGLLATHIAVGSAWKQVLQVAMDVQADVIFVGASGRRGVRRLVLGSVAERVTRTAPCPVVVVRDKDFHSGSPPEIEPICSDCARSQLQTHGEQPWCERHRAVPAHGRLQDVIP